MRVDAERISREKDEVCVFSGRERADAMVKFEHLGAGLRQTRKRAGSCHASADSQPCLAQEEPRIGDAVIGMKSDQGAGLFECCSTFERRIFGFQFAPWAVDEDQR